MIPSIESIVDGLLDGSIASAQAVGWLHQHAEGAANELRDFFAGKALQGLLATGEDSRNSDGLDGWDWHAQAAYAMADAMLKAGERP